MLEQADEAILGRAGELLARHSNASLSEVELAELAREHGIDLATAMLYRHIRTSPPYREFIDRIENAAAAPDGVPGAPRVVVVPGAFHQEYRHTGADGARMMELARSLGWEAQRIKLPDLSPMVENARLIAEILGRERRRPTILLSLSKGSADVRTAFAIPQLAEAMADVRAWINLSGIVTGTPLVQWFRARPLRCCGVRVLLRLRGQRFAVIDELQRGAGSALDGPIQLPSGVRAIHVMGFPLVRHLSDPWAQRGHARLAPLGPNDGGGNLLVDALRLPGDVYPMFGADHYLRPRWIDEILLKIFREAAQSLATRQETEWDARPKTAHQDRAIRP